MKNIILVIILLIAVALAGWFMIQKGKEEFLVNMNRETSGPGTVTGREASGDSLSRDKVAHESEGQKEPVTGPEGTVLRFGRIPFLNARDMVANHEKLMRYLEKELGVKEVRLILTPDYDELTRFMKEGKVDVGWYATLNYPRAHEETGCQAILRIKRRGLDTYRGIIITHVDSGIESLKDLRGRSFAFTEPSSASGYFYPRIMMMEAGIDPDRDLARADCIKGHDKIVYNVFLRKYDAGAVYDDAREKLDSQEQRDKIKIIAKTKEILNEPIVVRKDLDPALVAKLKAALLKLDIKNPVDREILQLTGSVDGFTEVTDRDYDPIRQDIKFYEEFMKKARGGSTGSAPLAAVPDENSIESGRFTGEVKIIVGEGEKKGTLENSIRSFTGETMLEIHSPSQTENISK